MSKSLGWIRLLAYLGLLGVVAAVAVVAIVYRTYLPQLPETNLQELSLQVPLRVYARDGGLIGEYGAERRAPLKLEEMPERLIQAFLAAEDARFFEHPGVDYQGILRAVVNLVATGEKSQGGSTITMQLARNYFLTREKSYERKIKEILLALRMENELSKNDILQFYLNKIYLGNRAYGVGAATQVYYGKDLNDLTLPEMAMVAGLPKAPSRYNPIINPDRATTRRNYVLRRMTELGFITDDEFLQATGTPISAQLHQTQTDIDAHYVSEMVRAQLYEQHGENIYTAGFEVITTIQSARQVAANHALRNALLAYDRRHGYRGPETRLKLEIDPTAEGSTAILEAALQSVRPAAGLTMAVVLSLDDESMQVYRMDAGVETLASSAWQWVLEESGKTVSAHIEVGDVLRLRDTGEPEAPWLISQVPEVQGALVAINPENGAIEALVGGYDYFLSKFNRAVQAQRQPGSAFKPFLYSAALENGYTAASIINDAPVVFDDPALEDTWRPENYSGKFYGPTRFREALVHSRNLVSIRLLQSLGIGRSLRYISQFGLDRSRMPTDLSLSLGSGAFTPLEIATAYAVFANGGFRVEPYFIEEIRTPDGVVIFRANPPTACFACERYNSIRPLEAARDAAIEQARRDQSAQSAAGAESTVLISADLESVPYADPLRAPRAIPYENAWMISSMMADVIRRGTARRARELGRSDLSGKTGTTNDQNDAWFSGFSPALVATSWIGFDQLKPLGAGETGGRAALPMWMEFMAVALENVPDLPMRRPEGLVSVRINPENGKLANAHTPRAIFESFPADRLPEPDDSRPQVGAGSVTPAIDELF